MAATTDIFAVVESTPAAQVLRRHVERGGLLSQAGIDAAAHAFVAALLAHLFPTRQVVLVTAGLKAQEDGHQDLSTWLEVGAEGAGREGTGLAPLFYPSWEILPHEDKLPHADVVSERLEALVKLAGSADGESARDRKPPAVASVAALLQRTFRKADLLGSLRTLKAGDQLDPLDLVEWLEAQGYEPEAKVSQKGEIALRGGILDVYPLTSPWPVRLEFFGNELESLRYFDPTTQVSRESIPSTVLPPAGELGMLKRIVSGSRAGGSEAQPQSAPSPAPLGTLLDYLAPDTILVCSEPEELERQGDVYEDQIPKGDAFFISWQDFLTEARERGLTILNLAETAEMLELWTPEEGQSLPEVSSEITTLSCQGLDAFRPMGERAPDLTVIEAQRRGFFGQLHRWLRQGYRVEVFCNNDGERQRFEEVWRDYGLAEASGAGVEATPSSPTVRLGTLGRGFICEQAKLVVVTDAEIFGRYRVQRPRRMKSAHAIATRSALDINFTELEHGDYVVHLQHGIGRFLGLQRLPEAPSRGRESAAPVEAGQECLAIEYAPSDSSQPAPRLYVPITEAHLVSKYVGAGRARPALNTLGGTRWAKAKAQAAAAVKDLAADLLRLQAARASQGGFAFPGDAPWQREFEGAFIYEETPDQVRAIAETKSDMEKPKPMDRLICGDVGFGKTEVAIRAAFKAVLAGKQVALLVPTTVLAQQHFNTLRERMADYPIRIELLSRFRSRRSQDGVIRELAAGAVDIVVGTHRLVQSDVAFKDLGLVIIDEEQRFGVMHKERLKQLRQLVDVLTLSATPIPRTLYLALTGARDMSTIETPPQDRLPVETIIAAYDERIIRDAILREMNRGGQVFFLHNRVFDIEAVAHRLRGLVPGARIEIGHGQMHADELEEVMTRFVNGDVDVLLSTTIIESGIDIPNANTILIDRADRFGLSDLYQLRGRVGRYKHQAYAYLLIPRHAGLLADARKRISAVKQFSSPGSGFKIALRDLEIRGAGNLLGPEQSGHITAVGFELYCQLLKQSVAALKGETLKVRVDVSVRLDFLDLSPPPPKLKAKEGKAEGAGLEGPEGRVAEPRAFAALPLEYVEEPQQRLEIYRRLAEAADQTGLDGIEKELRDRFGPLPPPVKLLMQVSALRLLAGERGVTAIETRADQLRLTRRGDFLMPGGKFPRLTKKAPTARLKEIRRVLQAM